MATLQQSEKEVAILLVEDDPGHARLIEKNLRRASVTNKIITVADGQTALDYLFAAGEKKGNHNLPLLVLLDLNIPGIDGYQVLKCLKTDERTRRIPVVVLTTADNPSEVTRCYDLGCNVFITKPVDYKRFSEAILELGMVLSILTIPKRGEK